MQCRPGGESRPDSDSRRQTVECWDWYDKSLLYSSSMSAALRVRKEKKQGHPGLHLYHLVPHDTLRSRGRLMTHSVHRGISGIWASNRQMQHKDMHTHLSEACMWYVYEYRPQQILFRLKFPYSTRLTDITARQWVSLRQTILDLASPLPRYKQHSRVFGSLPIVPLTRERLSERSQFLLDIWWMFCLFLYLVLLNRQA